MRKLNLLLLIFVTLSFSEVIHFTRTKTNEATINIEKDGPLSATFDLQIPSIGKFPKKQDRGVYDYIQIKNMPSIQEIGKPSLPVYKCSFAIPEGAKFSFKVLEQKFVFIDNVDVHPALRPHEEGKYSDIDSIYKANGWDVEPELEFDKKIYEKNAFYPGDLAMVSDVSVFRNTHLAEVRLCPVQYNPVTKKLKVYTKLKVKVEFTGGVYRSGLKNQSENIVKRIAVNGLDHTRRIQTRFDDDKADVLIITTPKFISPVNDLVQWQKQKGYDVLVESKSFWDTSAVRKAVKDYWDDNDSPEYVLIVGDYEDVPCDSVVISGFTIHTDLPYFCLQGNTDHFAEMANGRISVSTEAEARQFINKIIKYETDPTESSDFYQNVMVCSQFEDMANNKANDTADKRFTHTAWEIKNHLKDQGYTATHIADVENDEVNPLYFNADKYSFGEPVPEELRRPNCNWNAVPDDIRTEIDKGKLILLHRDHGTEKGWVVPRFYAEHAEGLDNGDMTPVIFSLNCLTGKFKHPVVFAEALTRRDDGAVGVVAASRESFSGYNDAFAHGLFDAIWPGTIMKSPKNENPVAEPHDPIYTMGDVKLHGHQRMKLCWGSIIPSFRFFHWFGDPTMEIWTAKPEKLNARHYNLIRPDATSFSLNGMNIEKGFATLYSKGSKKLVGRIEVNGSSAEIPVNENLTENDTLILTVRSHNYKPVITDIPVSFDQVNISNNIKLNKGTFSLLLNKQNFNIIAERELSVNIYSVNGQKVLGKYWKNVLGNIKLNTGKLSSGRYIVQIKQDDNKIVESTLIVR